jgi:3-hydroxy-3-methylglutaryl CoA synthase
MKYQEYVKIGCGIIGSGAIESAHRTLVQKRMKQSGQRWSCKGAQNMLNLRVVRKNNDWNKIIELTKMTLNAAA